MIKDPKLERKFYRLHNKALELFESLSKYPMVAREKRELTRTGNPPRLPKPVRMWDLGDGFTMIVGPTRSAIFLDVGYVDGERTHVIVHAMKAREKFLR